MEEIKKTIRNLFLLIDPDIRVDFFLEEENSLHIKVKMKDPQVLIGEKGQTLAEIERLLKAITRRKTDHALFVSLDINDYKKRKTDYLKELAKEAGDEVSLTGVEKKFPPMSPFERRIIHITLAERDDITTESTGSGHQKRVLIKKR